MRVATVDAVKNGVIHCTMAIEARGLPLMGQYVVIHLEESLLLGRLGSISLTNPIHDDPTFKPYIMAHGKVPEWSKEVDIEESTIQILGVIDGKNKKIPRQSNPRTGTDIEDLVQEDLERFYNDPASTLTLGVIPNTEGLRATIINRHHGEYDTGGYGEARHTAIFGQNGSAKTVLGLQLAVGKLVAHPEMGLLMPDTAGDLSDATRHNRGDFRWNYLEVLQAANVQVDVIDIGDIRLTSCNTLKRLLQPVLRQAANMDVEKAWLLADRIVEGMFENDEVDSSLLTPERIIQEMIERIATVYAKASKQTKTEEAEQVRDDLARRRPFERNLARVRQFFDGRERLGDLIRDILLDGRHVVIRMHDVIQEQEQEYVMRELMAHLTRRAQIVYKTEGRSCNALVVLDEGARWVPEGSKDEGDIGLIVERAFRETRKYGLGWMVISQRMSDVSKAVLTQAHTKYFGRGVGVGNDRRHLEDHLGAAGLEAYDQLEVQGGFFWVGIGMDANLGTEGTYFTLNPFGGDATQAFIAHNPHLFRRR